jgi:Xaa-Pro dipeptidase
VKLNEFQLDATALQNLVRGNLERLNTLMERDRIDAVFAIAYDNWRYLTGLPVHHSLSYANTNAAVYRQGDELPSLLPLDFFANGIRPSAPWYPIRKDLPFLGTPEAHQPTGTGKWPKMMADALTDLGLANKTVALDPGMPWVMANALQSLLPEARFRDAAALLAEARIIKTTAEIEAIRKACRIADIAIEGALASAREGISESELAGVCETLFRKNGAEYASMMPNVFSGDHSRLGYVSSSDRKIRSGDLVRLDIGCVIDGYCCCIARTGFVGPTDTEVSAAYALLRDTLHAGVEAVRPGVTNIDVHSVMCETLRTKSAGRYALDAYGGHGIGLGLHEQPMIGGASAVTEIVLQPGMVFAIEPSFRLEGKGWLGLEDNVAVTNSGVDLLNHARFTLQY